MLLFVLLCLYSINIFANYQYELNIFYPINNTVIGNKPLFNTYISLYQFNENGFIIPVDLILDHKINFICSMFINGNFIQNYTIDSNIFEFRIIDSFIINGLNTVRLRLTNVNEINLYKEYVILLNHYSNINNNINFNLLYESMTSNANYFSYLLVGFDHCFIQSIQNVNPKRLEIFLDDQTSNLYKNNNCFNLDDNISNPITKYHSFQSYEDIIRNIIYTDYTLISLDVLSRYIINNVNDDANFIMKLSNHILELIQITKKSLYVFVNSLIPWQLKLFDNNSNPIINHFTVFVFEREVNVILRAESEYFITNIKIYKLDIHKMFDSKHDSPLSLKMESFQHKDNSSDMSSSNDLLSNIVDHDIKYSRILLENYQPGKSFILLENSCIINDNNKKLSVLIFRPHNSSNSIINITHLQSNEDYGFLYTNMNLIDLAVDNEDIVSVTAQKNWIWKQGITALSMSVTTNHLLHELEPLLQLLFYAYMEEHYLKSNLYNHDDNYTCELNNEVDKLNFCSLKRGSYFENSINTIYNRDNWIKIYQYLREIKSLIIGNTDSYSLNDWLGSTIGLIFGYYKQLLSSNNDKKYISPSIYMTDHIFPTLRHNTIYTNSSDRLVDGVCFDMLLLLGRSNFHVTLFGDNKVMKGFRNYIHKYYNISYDKYSGKSFIPNQKRFKNIVNENIYGNLGQLNDSIIESKYDNDIKSPRERLIKVTIIIRAHGKFRKILNLFDLVNQLLNISYIDNHWLLSHIITLEQLSHQQQVIIFSETDLAINIYGASTMNYLYMIPGSVWLIIYNGNYIEYPSYFHEGEILRLSLPISDHINQTICPENLSPDCYMNSLNYGNGLNCLLIRQCSIYVDLNRLLNLVHEAYMHILSVKWISFY